MRNGARERQRSEAEVTLTAKLDVRSVSKRFGGVNALQDVSLSIEQTQLVGLIGPNGSGKSTLVNCITGYYKPDSGEVTALGTRISGLPPHRIFRLGVARTFQTPQLYPELDSMQHLRIATLWQHEGKESGGGEAEGYDEILNLLGLADRKETRASLLTHFERKKLEIGSRLVASPKFLLLDEPAAGLSPEEIEALLDIIRAIQRRGTGVLVIEHTMHVILSLSERVEVLDQGKLIASGTSGEITSNPAVVEAYLGKWKPREEA